MKKRKQNSDSAHIRTVQIMVRKGSPLYRQAAYCCQLARRVKNATHYLIRHEKNDNGNPFSHRDADKWLKRNNPGLYRKLPSSGAQRMTQIAGEEWSSFYQALKRYKASPDSFCGRPRPPRYARAATTFYLGRNGFKVEAGWVVTANTVLPSFQLPFVIDQPINAKAGTVIVQELRVVPKGNHYALEIIYDESQLAATGSYCLLMDKTRHAGIDLGINNLMAIATNQPDIAPVLVKGKHLKSINADFNKRIAALRSAKKYAHIPDVCQRRNRRINDELHHASRAMVTFCEQHDIGTVVIGYNQGWKRGVSIGSVNNQKFVGIPHLQLMKQLCYKLRAVGVTVIVREESYTSKASARHNDPLPMYHPEKASPAFSGKRKQRGLYVGNDGVAVNADINGAYNILRKESGEDLSLACRGIMNMPVVIERHRKTTRREKALPLAA